MFITIKNSSKSQKRFDAFIDSKTKIISFGQRGGSTFIDHHDKQKKKNYIKRHCVNEDWTKINAGSLSRYLLWNKPSLVDSANDFAQRFGVTTIYLEGIVEE